MGLFDKKSKTVNCAICGAEAKTGFFRGLFQSKIEGQYVCSDCYGVIDLPAGMVNTITLEEFKEYRAFREENQKLKDIFQITEEVDFGALDSKFFFDLGNRLMCAKKDLSTTIFEAQHIRDFIIKEDENVIFQGSPSGFLRNESHVPNQIMIMTPQITQIKMAMDRYRQRLDRASDGQKEQIKKEKPTFHLTEPFRNFLVEIHFDHPYWQVMTADISAPSFDDDDPDVNEYLNAYYHRYGIVERLANALTEMAFPGALGGNAYANTSFNASFNASGNTFGNTAQAADPVEELKRYKELLDMGILTQEEFNAKKRQLLGL